MQTVGQKARSASSLSRELQQSRTTIAHHPSKGGSTGYPVHQRLQILVYANIHSTKKACKVFDASRRSLARWRKRLIPFRSTGNKERSTLVGNDQYLLCLCLILFPRSRADQIAAFIYENGGEAYNRYEIYKRSKELNFSRKKASLEANEAYTPFNILRSEMFWSEPPRVGVNGVKRSKLLDVDETRFRLKEIEPKYGYALRPCRIRDTGHYKRGDQDVVLLMAIEPGNFDIPADQNGSTANPRSWWLLTDKNVDQHVFAKFIDSVCSNIEEYPLDGDDERIFLWDNLSAHQTGIVSTTLEDRPTKNEHKFISIPRPPYQPKWAPIEYIFCQVASALSRHVEKEWTNEIMKNELHDILMGLGKDGKFNRTFAHCGY